VPEHTDNTPTIRQAEFLDQAAKTLLQKLRRAAG
jgi:hypothetical protein